MRAMAIMSRLTPAKTGAFDDLPQCDLPQSQSTSDVSDHLNIALWLVKR
jgi:hypothetical protein